MRLFGACKFQPVKGEAKVWQAAELDVSRAALESFAKAADGGPPFPITFEQMIHGSAVTEAIVKSAASEKAEHVA
jgi:predicted dehydrogenase